MESTIRPLSLVRLIKRAVASLLLVESCNCIFVPQVVNMLHGSPFSRPPVTSRRLPEFLVSFFAGDIGGKV